MDENLFEKFLTDPTLENFLELRTHHLKNPEFDPYSGELKKIDPLIQGERVAEAVRVLQQAISPNHLLSPAAHLKLAVAHGKLGEPEKADAERAIGIALLEGIQRTGEGTPEKPYWVTRTSDEYDVLLSQQLQFEKQSLREREGRRFDVLQTKCGKELWFDVTDLFAVMARRLKEPSA